MTDRGPLPPKLYFRIGEVANLVGVEPHVLRYWEREFRSIRPTKSAKGQRVYSRRDVESLIRVRELLYGQGFTIAGARRRLRDKDDASHATDTPASDKPVPAHAEPVVTAAPALAVAVAREALSRDEAPPKHMSQRVRVELEALKAEVESLLAELGA
jgi:DNA-binding transcriptional MerR regulator